MRPYCLGPFNLLTEGMSHDHEIISYHVKILIIFSHLYRLHNETNELCSVLYCLWLLLISDAQ